MVLHKNFLSHLSPRQMQTKFGQTFIFSRSWHFPSESVLDKCSSICPVRKRAKLSASLDTVFSNVFKNLKAASLSKKYVVKVEYLNVYVKPALKSFLAMGITILTSCKGLNRCSVSLIDCS